MADFPSALTSIAFHGYVVILGQEGLLPSRSQCSSARWLVNGRLSQRERAGGSSQSPAKVPTRTVCSRAAYCIHVSAPSPKHDLGSAVQPLRDRWRTRKSMSWLEWVASGRYLPTADLTCTRYPVLVSESCFICANRYPEHNRGIPCSKWDACRDLRDKRVKKSLPQ